MRREDWQPGVATAHTDGDAADIAVGTAVANLVRVGMNITVTVESWSSALCWNVSQPHSFGQSGIA